MHGVRSGEQHEAKPYDDLEWARSLTKMSVSIHTNRRMRRVKTDLLHMEGFSPPSCSIAVSRRCPHCAQCRQLGPHHILGDPFPADEGAEAAIDASDHAFAIAYRGDHGLDALRNHLGMFDEIALRIDHTGDQDPPVGQSNRLSGLWKWSEAQEAE
jgi:hypothetical protein